MNDDSGGALGVLFLLGLLVAAYLTYTHWSTVTHTEPIARDEHGALWLPTRDVAAGETLRGRVVVGGHLRVAIRGVIVNGAGPEQITEGRAEAWGDTITTKLADWNEATDSLAFAVNVPADAAGRVLHLEVRTEYVAAESHGFQFTNEWNASTMRVELRVQSPTTSMLRRTGKAALALASWLAALAVIVVIRRRHARARREVSGYWALALVPHAAFGWACFVVLVADATRVHTAWLAVLALAVWYAMFLVAPRLSAGPSSQGYLLVQVRVSPPVDDIYRAGPPVPTASVAELVDACQTAGLAVQHDKRTLTITRLDGRTARIAIPASGTFGGAAPITVHTDEGTLVADIAAAAAPVLGELLSSDGARRFARR